MDQYREWQDEEENISIKCPIHNCVISPKSNQVPYRINQMITPNYSQPELEIFHSPMQSREEIINNEYNNYNINNLSPNQNMQNNYYNYPQYSYQNKQQYNYSNQYYNIRNNNENNSSSNLSTNESSSLRRYESSDGVLRGYTNNYSFYVSGSSQNRPKITINNQYSNNNYNFNQNRNLNQRKYINKNAPSPQRVGAGQFQRVIFPNNNIQNRQINQNENSYIIRVVENEPNNYNQTNQRPIMNNYNNNNNGDDDVYYYENENNNETRNIPPQRNYRVIQRRMVKRVVDKEPMDRKGFFINEPMDNRRNMYKNNINIEQKKPFYQKINNYSNNNINLRKFNSSNISGLNETHNNINRTDYFISYPPRRLNTPNIPKSNINPNTINYPRPNQSRQQKIIGLNQNYQKNSNNSITYQSTSYLPYRAFTEQNDYIYTRTEGNSPRNKSPYLKYSPNININNNYIHENRYTNFMRPRQREYTSRTEFQNQREYENENDEDDDIYEVPEQFNNNINSNRECYEERRRNIPSERPFMRINNYSQTQRNGKKYGVYTQTLAMNTNYNNNEYEVDRRDIRNNNKMRENRGNYSVPKIMRPISDVQRLVRQNREYSAFERSLRNIRDNEEEIELDNEERNNRVRIKTSGSNNHRLFISDNNKGRPSRKYKTFTELQENRAEGYILQDIDDNSDEFDMYQNIKNRNVIKNKNLRIIKNENKYRPPPPKYEPEENNYYEEENIERIKNIQKINNRNKEDELEDEENDNNDEEEQIYDSKQLINTKEDNFRIVHNNKMVKRREEFNEEELQDQNNAHGEDIDENEIEGQEEIIHQTNVDTEEDLYQRGEEIPQDNDEITPMTKNIKNIQTEINEKYYDNQGNYLGEKKIITTKQVPVINKNQREELEEGEYFEEQEEQEDNENENDNENEYTPYQSNNKKFKKRGEKNINEKNHKESKYHSYFGDSNNNVYYEIKGSGEINKEEESKNEEEIENRKYKEPMVLVNNVTFGIQSENLCVPAEDNDNEEKENIDEKDNNDEKEADEQQIDENAEIDEEEDEQNHFNKTNENNDGNNNSNVNEQQKIINQNIDEDNNLKEKESEKDNEQNNNNEYNNKQINENKDYNIINTNDNINEENNIKEHKQEDKMVNDEVSNNSININDNNEDNNTNKEDNINIEDNNININNNETNNGNISDKKNIETIEENLEDKNDDEINNGTNKENDKIGNENSNENLNIENNYENNIEKINENINENINNYSNNNNIDLNQNENKGSNENINEIIKNENNEKNNEENNNENINEILKNENNEKNNEENNNENIKNENNKENNNNENINEENNNENIDEENMYEQNNENIDEENMYEQNNENIDEENMYKQNNENIDEENMYEQNNYEQNNENINEINYEYNDEEEQFVEENEAEEIENQNIQKDEDREIDVGEGLVDIEDNNNYNYEENEIIIGEEGEIEGEGEGEGEEEKGGEYNIIEGQNTHKENNEANDQEN